MLNGADQNVVLHKIVLIYLRVFCFFLSYS